MDGYMTTREAAEALGVTKGRVLQLINAGILEAEQVGRVYAVSAESVERRRASNPGPGNPNIKPGYSPRWQKGD